MVWSSSPPGGRVSQGNEESGMAAWPQNASAIRAEADRLLSRIGAAARSDRTLAPDTVGTIDGGVAAAARAMADDDGEAAANALSLIKESAAANDDILLLASDVEVLLDALRR